MLKLSRISFAAIMLLNAAAAMSQEASTGPALVTPASSYESSLASHFKADAPGAALIVTKNGQLLFRKAYGMASLESGQALNADMSLRLGSITKQFTAVAILQLVDEGKLALSDDITKYLPDFPKKDKPITIEHLLTHTSGIPSYTGKRSFDRNMADDKTVAQMIDTFKNDRLEFVPGERYKYNNSGYFLLGAIIEKISGKRYADYMAQHIFEPLGMKDTAHEGFERSKAVAARGYRPAGGKFEPHAPLSMTQPYAAGSLVSTVDDLARWDAAIGAGKLLKAGTWKQAFTPYKLADGTSTGYGYGWVMSKVQGSDVIAHGGGINGFSSYAMRFPAEGVYVAVLSNTEGGMASSEMIATKAAAIAIGKPLPDFKAIKLDAAALEAFVGSYKIDDKEERVITRRGDKLFMQRTGRGKIALVPHAPDGFFVPESVITVKFGKNAQGEVNQLTISQQGTETVSPRVR